MGLKVFQVFVLCLSIQFLIVAAATNSEDAAALNSLNDVWKNLPPSWQGSDPCGDSWDGIQCNNSRVTSISLSSMGLSGILSGDITTLSELEILDLSFNKDLRGSLPETIGNLKKLTNLILVGCGFSGPIPDSIGSLSELLFLSLNSNSFTGRIPPSVGHLSKLYWLDLADNQLTGTIPVSSGNSPGLDMLLQCGHFHLGKNQFSGTIPEKLFSPKMVLIHVLLESNKLTGKLPYSLGLVKTLQIVRFDQNQLSGPVPTNLNNLTSVNHLYLSNNKLTGSMPDLTGLSSLSYLDLSNNSFDASVIPSWFLTLQSLTTIMMESTQLQGEVSSDLFSLPNLQEVNMKKNRLNGTLNVGSGYSTQLKLIDLQNNHIAEYNLAAGTNNIDIILESNPICEESSEPKDYCTPDQESFTYSTRPNNCMPSPCSSDQISSPNCHCAYPYTGTLLFRAPSFSGLGNISYFKTLEENMTRAFRSYQFPVDSISLSNPRKDSNEYLNLNLQVFPSGAESFNRTGISSLGFVLSNPTYRPPHEFGAYSFFADQYQHFAGSSTIQIELK